MCNIIIISQLLPKLSNQQYQNLVFAPSFLVFSSYFLLMSTIHFVFLGGLVQWHRKRGQDAIIHSQENSVGQTIKKNMMLHRVHIPKLISSTVTRKMNRLTANLRGEFYKLRCLSLHLSVNQSSVKETWTSSCEKFLPSIHTHLYHIIISIRTFSRGFKYCEGYSRKDQKLKFIIQNRNDRTITSGDNRRM